MDITLLIPILIFIGIVVLVFLIFFFVNASSARRELRKRIRIKNVSFGPEKPKKAGFFTGIVSLFGNIAKPKREEDVSFMQKNLTSLGYRSKRAVRIFLGVKFLLTILFSMGFLLLKIFVLKALFINNTTLMLIIVLLGMGGFYLPGLWLWMKIKKRKRKILEGLPDALDLLGVCTQAGMGMYAAIDRVAEEIKLDNEIISAEFKLYNLELMMGKARVEALKSLAFRTGVEDVRNLVTLLIQTDRFGTSVARALKTHSDYMRIQRAQRAEEAAVKLPVKLLFPLIFFIFPSLFVVILGPAVLQTYRIFSH